MRECRQCGNDISHRRGNAVYCGEICHTRWKTLQRNPDAAKRRWPRECLECNRNMEGYPSSDRYCSDACRRHKNYFPSWKEPTKHTCTECSAVAYDIGTVGGLFFLSEDQIATLRFAFKKYYDLRAGYQLPSAMQERFKDIRLGKVEALATAEFKDLVQDFPIVALRLLGMGGSRFGT